MYKSQGNGYYLGVLLTFCLGCLSLQANPVTPGDDLYDLEGILEIRAVFSHQTGQEVVQYILNQDDDVYYLSFSDEVPATLVSGDRILLRYAKAIISNDGSKRLLISAQDLVVISSATALPSSFGPQNTIVFLVNFQDQPTNQPWTLDQVNRTVFTDINNMFYESSYHQTTIIGRVVGWYTLAVNSTTPCTELTDLVASQAATAATQAGIDLSPYKRRIFMFPRNSVCHWSGLGTVGTPGAFSKTWMNGFNVTSIIGHELGHNFGLYHARRLVCDGGPNTGNCSLVEYGDGSDIMGNGQATHFNAYQKDVLGWLNYQNSPPIQTVTTSGSYTIDPYELFNNNVKALKILKRVNANGSKDYYYIEFRQGIGYDLPLKNCSNCDYTSGVLIHQGNSTSYNSSDLLDLTPTDNNANRVALLPGQSFTDSTAGVTFTLTSAQSSGAVVNVTLGNTPPPPPPPPETELKNGIAIANLSGAKDNEAFFYVDVPAQKTLLTIKTSGGTGDCDLYVNKDQRPSDSVFQCRPYTGGNNETCTFNNPPAGKYYVRIKGYNAYSGVSLVANY